MNEQSAVKDRHWQLQHYANVGQAYGSKHFTQKESEYSDWILTQIGSVQPQARRIAEVGSGTCIFAHLLGSRLPDCEQVVCYEPVAELLAAARDFPEIQVVHGGAVEFARQETDQSFDLIYTKDTAHHFASDTLPEIHCGFCRKLRPGGRYLMAVRTPPVNELVPVGSVACARWSDLYTPLTDLLLAIRAIEDWREVEVSRWEKAVATRVDEWIAGVQRQDTWSVFSALSQDETSATVRELTERFSGADSFQFLHQYDVAVFEKR